MNKKISAFDIILYIFMILVVIITIYPFLNVLAVSFNDSMDTIKGTSMIWPRKPTLSNYNYIFFGSDMHLWHAAFISVLRTVIGTLTGVISCCMLAYTISRRDFMFRKFVSTLLVVTMYVSGGMIPEYMLTVNTLHLNNKFLVYILPGLVSAFNCIIIRSFIDGLPISIQESAKIDGANDFVIFCKIIMPLCMPVIATVSLFIAVGQWGSWFDTYLYAGSRQELSTLQYELMKVLDNTTASSMVGRNPNQTNIVSGPSPDSIRMAITIVVTLPIVMVYPFLQKYFVSGMTVGAVK